MTISSLSPSDLSTIRSTLLCAPMTDQILDPILQGATISEYKRHERLFEAGTPAAQLHIVLDGWVRLSREETDGAQTMIAAFTTGDSFAEAAAFLNQPYPATAQAMSKTRTIALDGSRILDSMLASREVLSAGISSIFRRLHYLMHEIESLKSRTIRQRVVEFLLKAANETEGASDLRLPYDKSLIAAKIGTSPENLSRTFAELRDFGVTLDGRDAHIESVEALEALLHR